MALFTPSESPAVVVKEVDLTGGVPNVQSTTGGTVVWSRWGPAGERVLINSEAQLMDTFGAPDASNTLDMHRAATFLRYSNSLWTVRAIKDSSNGIALDRNSISRRAQTGDYTYRDSNEGVTIRNKSEWDASGSGITAKGTETFIAKYPGTIGNSLAVHMCSPEYKNTAGAPFVDSAISTVDSATNFKNWAYKGSFDTWPSTSAFAASKGSKHDECHVVVVDSNGLFTGIKGTVLETYPNVSVAKDATTSQGVNNYMLDVINEKSEYIWAANHLAHKAHHGNNASGQNYDSAVPFYAYLGDSSTQTFHFDSGSNAAPTIGNYNSGFDLLADKDQVEVDFLIAPSWNSYENQATQVNHITSIAATRKDCIAVASPARDAVLRTNNAATITTNIVNSMTARTSAWTRSSYLVADGNFTKIYDKYNDQYIRIPAAPSTAGIMAATDLNRAAWFSPAGSKRGQYLGITSLTWTPTKGQRDTLYKDGVNPIANIPGSGPILFGDKTFLTTQSAFSRINVRRLFLVLERAIAKAAESVLFEFNDEFTRAEFVNIIEPVLREVKGRRGITDFRVIADETNNTAAVIDRNEFIANIFIKPARSINYVTLNFVATRTGVDFAEVAGTV